MQTSRFDPHRDEPHAFIHPEDTYRVLAADPTPRPPSESLDTLEARAMRAPAYTPGSVVIEAGRPLRLLAVVHDLEREPTWRPAWIREALIAAFRAAHMRGLTHVAAPLLGTVHGRAPPDEALEWLAQALRATGDQRPHHLYLVDAPADAAERLLAALS